MTQPQHLQIMASRLFSECAEKGQKIATLSTKLTNTQAEVKRLRHALEQISEDQDTHTALTQQRLCCKFQNIATLALEKELEV